MRILLIEDDQLIGDGLNVGLGKLGFTIDWFTNGLNRPLACIQYRQDSCLSYTRFGTRSFR